MDQLSLLEFKRLAKKAVSHRAVKRITIKIVKSIKKILNSRLPLVQSTQVLATEWL